MPAHSALQAARAVPSWGRVALARRGRGPLVACLPARGAVQSSLLRIHNVAAALEPFGWRAVVLPWKLSLRQRQAMLAELAPDVVLMQGARHDLNRPALYPGLKIVYDMDDADFHLPHLAGPVLRAMGEVEAVITGSEYVAEWCRAAGARAHVVWTGSPVSRRPRTPQALRPPVIAWAQSRPMTYAREADLVFEVMSRLQTVRPDAVLRLYDRRAGDDPGFLRRFWEAGIAIEWLGRLGYRDYLASLDDVAVGLAPLCPETPFSRGKSFGKVLAYLDRKVPILASDACEHGRFFTPGTGVITNDPAIWVAMLDHLLSVPADRQAMADAAFAAFRQKLTLGGAAEKISEILTSVACGQKRRVANTG